MANGTGFNYNIYMKGIANVNTIFAIPTTTRIHLMSLLLNIF